MTDRPRLGILLMLGFCITAPMGDALAKIIGETVPLLLLLFVRFAVQALLLFPLVAIGGRAWRIRGKTHVLAWLRTGLHIAGIGTMFTALQYLPLAVAIAFVMPFIMLILGHYVLGEEIGMRRVLACCVGFIGTLLVIQPAFSAVGWPALLPLAVAVIFSLFMLVTRMMARDVDPIGLQTVNGAMAVVILIPLSFVVGPEGGIAHATLALGSREIWLLLTIGAIGTLAHLLMTWSLRYAPAATLAPMQYLEIPFATLIGWLVFAELPNTLASVGIAITISAGLYIVMRERAMTRVAPPAV
jgi:drug/metabolite transporter (DMT)-like permease